MTNLESEITSNAQGPKSVTGDQGTVEQHSIKDLIAADQYLQEQTARNKSKLPIRLGKLRADGTA